MKNICPLCGHEMRYSQDGPGNAWGSKPYPLYQCSGCSFWRRKEDFCAIRKVFSFDVESDGLWGAPFAIGAVVKYLESGIIIDTFQACLPDIVVTDKWVIENVLPSMEKFPVTHENRESMIKDFGKFYMAYRQCRIVCHIPCPVETSLIAEMHRRNLIGDFDAPFPLIDVAPMLALIGENPLSVDEYTKKHQLKVEGRKTHDPLYDADAACEVYRHIMLSK